MSEAVERKIAELEDQLDEVTRELLGTQEMLAFVLKAVDAPVVVDRALLTEGLPAGTQIQVDEDLENSAFVFSLGVTV